MEPANGWLRWLVAGGVALLVVFGFLAIWLGVRQGDLGTRNCENVGTLAHITHTQVEAQSAATKALLAKGYTFGIPKSQLPALIAAGAAVQRRYLNELDDLTRANC